MNTRIFNITDPVENMEDVEAAAGLILGGKLVAIPTETVYGLGSNALDGEAVKRIYEAKGRPQDNPLIIHIACAGELDKYCRGIPDGARKLAGRFWPGPLTMVLKRRDIIPDGVTAGLDTVAVRCPDSAVTLAVIRSAGVPIAAPSANISGKPSPTTAQHVINDLGGKIDGIIDGGPCSVGLESTIIDMTSTPPRLLRPGAITPEQLRAVLGDIEVDKAVTRVLGINEIARAPGMKYRHYAPSAAVVIVRGDRERAAGYIRERMEEGCAVLCFDEEIPYYKEYLTVSYGPEGNAAELARNLFSALRRLDGPDIKKIYARYPEGSGIACAVENRLGKAAGFNIVDV